MKSNLNLGFVRTVRVRGTGIAYSLYTKPTILFYKSFPNKIIETLSTLSVELTYWAWRLLHCSQVNPIAVIVRVLVRCIRENSPNQFNAVSEPASVSLKLRRVSFGLFSTGKIEYNYFFIFHHTFILVTPHIWLSLHKSDGYQKWRQAKEIILIKGEFVDKICLSANGLLKPCNF